ncbi:MAG: prolyl oligopeptidase family serine peptidase [Phycisphaerales bacterium]|nr:MAG: prolyl oligopeptidase family serine peptidase [Phycisphaerales bacterium]
MKRFKLGFRVLVYPLLVVCLSCRAAADERQILHDVKAFFEASNAEMRAELVRKIESNPAYDRTKVSDYLLRAGLFDKKVSGWTEINVSVLTGANRDVLVRIPEGYTPKRRWPLIYALHAGGTNATWALNYMERVLGSEAEQYLIAAPTNCNTPDFDPYDMPAVLFAVKKLVSVDSDRVYATGYSAGGMATWALTVLHPDEFAAFIPIAGSVYIGAQTNRFLPNLANTYVFNVWGAQDTLPGWRGEGAPGIAESNRRLIKTVESFQLPVDSYEFPNKGHHGIEPPHAALMSALRRVRTQYPPKVDHVFQHARQARAYWLERNVLRGERWPGRPLPSDMKPGEDGERAIERALRGQQAEFHGRIDGQTVTVTSRDVEGLTVWFGDGMIDWQEEVHVVVDDAEVFKGKLKPDLYVCLMQARRAYDFDRLRWAGLMLNGTNPAEPVTGKTRFFNPVP